jgi:AsmA protein
MSGNDLSLGPALAEIQNDVPVEGYVNLHADVSASGDSPHELASSLDGTFGFGLENARVPRRYIEYLAVDVFGWAFNTATRRDPYASLDCVMAGFDIKDGVATSNLLAADGPSLTVAGTAILNFGDETMDMTLLPRQKKSLFSELSPVHIKGPMRDPEVTALPVKSAVTSLGTLALVPTLPMVAIPAILGEKLWSSLNDHDRSDGGCVKLAKKIEKQKEKKEQWWKFW